MKKIINLAVLLVVLISINSCTYSHSCKTKSYLLPYFEVNRISSAQNENNIIRVVSFRTQQEKWEYIDGYTDFVDNISSRKEFYKGYAEFYNDKGYKGTACYEYHHPEYLYVLDEHRIKAWPEIAKIEVITKGQYDSNHPQGSLLNDIIRVKKSPVYDYIQKGYPDGYIDLYVENAYYRKNISDKDAEIIWNKVEEPILSQFSNSDYYLMGLYIPNDRSWMVEELLSAFELPDYFDAKKDPYYLYFDLKFTSLPDEMVDIEVKITRIDDSVVTAQCTFDPNYNNESNE